MLELYFGDTNIANPLDETQMNALIETFVAVHGEERREIITERLKSAKFLFLPRERRSDLTRSRYERYQDELFKADVDKMNEVTRQYKFIEEFFGKINKERYSIDRKTNSEVKDLVLSRLPELFNMTKEEFNYYTYSKGQIEGFVRIYSNILSRDRESFADEKTLTSYYEREYLAFFRAMGVYLGDSIADYANDEDFMDRLFDNELQEEILFIKEQNEKLKLQNNPFFQDAVKEIQSLDIKGGNLSFIETIYQYMFRFYNTSALVLPYMKKDGSCGTICLLPLEFDLSRETFLHECEHIVEMCLLQVEDGTMVSKAGFDAVHLNIDTEDYDGENLDFDFDTFDTESYEERPNRAFEVISEVWNDLFAHILYHKSTECGLTIGSLGLDETWYVKTMRFIADTDVYLDRILEARMNDDPKAFENLFGTELSTELNELVNKYYNSIMSGNIKFNGFELHLERVTELPITEVDFFNLPEGEVWTGFEKEVIKLHQEMALLAKRIEEHFSGDTNAKQEENEQN